MARRGRNEGSIYRRKDGRWVCQVQIGYKPDGSRKFATYYGKTRKEVADKLSDSIYGLNQGTFVKPNSTRFDDWIKYFVLNYKKNYVRPTTYARYISFMNCHILPEFGQLKIQDIRSTHIQRLYNKMFQHGTSPASLKHLNAFLRQTFQEAVYQKIIPQNPCEHVVRPKIVRKEVTVFTPEEQQRFVSVLGEDTASTIIKVALGTGARIGEVFGLTWKNVDFKNRCIYIEQNVARFVDYDDELKEHHTVTRLNDLKTDASHRMIPLTDSLINILQKYKNDQHLYFNKNVDTSKFPDMVFLNENGKLMEYSSFRRIYANLLKKADLPFLKIHALRHTFATRILEANIHPKVAQQLLGHTTATITLDIYSHVLPDQKYEAIKKIEGIV